MPPPEESDGKIRRIAELLGHGGIIQLLDDVRNKLLGNAFHVQDMAMQFARNRTLADAGADIDKGVQAVAGTWSGRAAAQFNTYAASVGKALGEQQAVIGSMSGILSGIAGCVIKTYSKAIEFIGTCAVELGKLGYKVIVAIATSTVPIVDVFTSKDVIDAVVDAFATLITAINGLFAQAVSTLGDFRAQATAIVQGDTNFPDLPPLPANSGMDNEKQWRIDPSAAPA
ncbi:hypothetical protein [Amycolatopsis sp. NPDC004169]|uniref:hypothetical protein n=1 Tax=Amycolatopsis sp. NPDC004169 TaxID=3154453 RepID=UPI00339FE6F4